MFCSSLFVYQKLKYRNELSLVNNIKALTKQVVEIIALKKDSNGSKEINPVILQDFVLFVDKSGKRLKQISFNVQKEINPT